MELLGAHHDVRAAIRLAQGDGDLGHCGLAVGIEQLGTVQDDGVVLLTRAGQESGHVDERDDRNIEGVAETYETGTLTRGVHVEHTSIAGGLVGHDTYALAVEAGKAHDDVLGELGLHFEELAVVGDGSNDLIHVVSLVGVLGDDLVQAVLHTVDRILSGLEGSGLHVVRGDVAQQGLQHLQTFLLSSSGEVGHTRLRGVYAGTAEVLLVDILASDGLHHLRAGEEHIRRVLHHQREVGEGGGVDGTAGTRTEDA